MNQVKKYRATSYISWEEFQKFIEYCAQVDRMICAYAVISTYCGLRMSDVLKSKWEDFEKEVIVLNEKKTGKLRRIRVHPKLKEMISNLRRPINQGSDLIFVNKSGEVISQVYLNRMIKRRVKDSGVSTSGNISSHMFRKTFARHIWDKQGRTEHALTYIQEMFNHTTIMQTKKYLGIRQEELDNLYLSM